MKKIFLSALLFATICCSRKNETTEVMSAKTSEASVITASIFSSEYGGYGYDITINGKVKIHQPNIPVIHGSRGFKTKEGAQKVANLVISKIKKNIMPPTTSYSELQKLDVIN